MRRWEVEVEMVVVEGVEKVVACRTSAATEDDGIDPGRIASHEGLLEDV